MKSLYPMRFITLRPESGSSAPGLPPSAAELAEKFRKVVLPHLDGAYNLARYLTRDAALSDDVVQDAMLRAFRSFGQFRGGSPRAWLFAIVRNCCRTAQPGSNGRVSLVAESNTPLTEQPDPAPDPEQELGRRCEIA